MSSTFGNALDQLIDDVPSLGYKLVLATVTNAALTVTTTDPAVIKGGAGASKDRFTNRFLYIPGMAATEDQVKTIAQGGLSVSAAGTATLTTTGPNFTAGSTNETAYILAIHPNALLNLGNDALEYQLTECPVPLRHGPASADMQGGAVDADWTESGATDAVTATAASVFLGAQMLDVTDSGSGSGYTESALNPVAQGEQVRLHAIVSSQMGTSVLQALDGSGNVQDSISSTQLAWMYLSKTLTFDSTDEQMRLRLLESGASDRGFWQAAWFVKTHSNYFQLPAWIDERFKVKDVARWQYHQSGLESDTWLADSYEDFRLNEGSEYRFVKRGSDANPVGLLLTHAGMRYISEPLFVYVSCPWSAPYGVSATFSGYTSTTGCPLHLLTAQMEVFLGQREPESFPGLADRAEKKLLQREVPRSTARAPLPSAGGPRELL